MTLVNQCCCLQYVNKQTTRELAKGDNQKVAPRGDKFYSIFIKVVPSDIFTSEGYHFYLIDIFQYFTSKNVINMSTSKYK